MKSLIRIINLNNSSDRSNISKIITNMEGIIAFEINLSKKEIIIIHDELILSLEEIVSSMELAGYMVT